MSALPPKPLSVTGMSALCHRRTRPYSITSSAIASTPGGIVRPSALAVFERSVNQAFKKAS
jgi:hypothetical protein